MVLHWAAFMSVAEAVQQSFGQQSFGQHSFGIEHLVEEIVLAPFELGNSLEPDSAVFVQRCDGTGGITVFTRSERRLGHERPKAGIIGGVDEVRELLIEDP